VVAILQAIVGIFARRPTVVPTMGRRGRHSPAYELIEKRHRERCLAMTGTENHSFPD
jgi:hypothetical protein